MKRLVTICALSGLLMTGCMKEEAPPAGDLDSIESTLNSVESELDEP